MDQREYPKLPMVGVGGVVISEGRALLIQRGNEPARGEWTVPGGLLEVGETLVEGVARELREETGLTVRVLELIEVVERIFFNPSGPDSTGGPSKVPGTEPEAEAGAGPKYHYVILDYLCEAVEGETFPSDEVTDMAFVREKEMGRYSLMPETIKVLGKAFAMARARNLR